LCDTCLRDYVAATAVVHAGQHKFATYAGVFLPGGREGVFEDAYPAKEYRLDVGFGYFLHWAVPMGNNAVLCTCSPMLTAVLDSKALMCPCVVQIRPKDDISKLLEDMPADYVTDTMFALGICQVANKRKLTNKCGN
jgi:hypothetical protein